MSKSDSPHMTGTPEWYDAHPLPGVAQERPSIDWHEFVNLVYRLVPDGDVRGPIIGAAARLSWNAASADQEESK